MIYEMLHTIQGLIITGTIFGLIVGFLVSERKVGCAILLAAPIAMIGYIGWWQGVRTENLRSTSGLDFFFGSLWPSVGAILGYYFGQAFRLRFRGQ